MLFANSKTPGVLGYYDNDAPVVFVATVPKPATILVKLSYSSGPRHAPNNSTTVFD